MLLTKNNLTVQELINIIKEVDHQGLAECFEEDFDLFAEEVKESKIKNKTKLAKFLKEWVKEIQEHYNISS